MFDHVLLKVRSLERSKRFYGAALEALGVRIIDESPGYVGFGSEPTKPALWITEGEAGGPAHLAFASPDRRSVDAFHAAATAHGGTDNGKPGLRPDYHARYYGAFAFDPDGNNVEAVCQR